MNFLNWCGVGQTVMYDGKLYEISCRYEDILEVTPKNPTKDDYIPDHLSRKLKIKKIPKHYWDDIIMYDEIQKHKEYKSIYKNLYSSWLGRIFLKFFIKRLHRYKKRNKVLKEAIRIKQDSIKNLNKKIYEKETILRYKEVAVVNLDNEITNRSKHRWEIEDQIIKLRKQLEETENVRDLDNKIELATKLDKEIQEKKELVSSLESTINYKTNHKNELETEIRQITKIANSLGVQVIFEKDPENKI